MLKKQRKKNMFTNYKKILSLVNQLIFYLQLILRVQVHKTYNYG